jgi:hypothetical protein
MSKMQLLFQITGSGLFGFDSLSCNSRLDEDGASSLEVHPGYRYMVQEVNCDKNQDKLKEYPLSG